MACIHTGLLFSHQEDNICRNTEGTENHIKQNKSGRQVSHSFPRLRGGRKIVRSVLDERKRKGRKRTQEWKQEVEVGVIRVHSFYVCLELSQ